MIIYIKSKKRKKYNNLKYTKTKSHQPKVEFLRTQILINLQQRCKKNNLPKYEEKKNKRERERDNLLCRKTMHKMGERIPNLQ